MTARNSRKKGKAPPSPEPLLDWGLCFLWHSRLKSVLSPFKTGPYLSVSRTKVPRARPAPSTRRALLFIPSASPTAGIQKTRPPPSYWRRRVGVVVWLSVALASLHHSLSERVGEGPHGTACGVHEPNTDGIDLRHVLIFDCLVVPFLLLADALPQLLQPN